jgi:hypothetical protein
VEAEDLREQAAIGRRVHGAATEPEPRERQGEILVAEPGVNNNPKRLDRRKREPPGSEEGAVEVAPMERRVALAGLEEEGGEAGLSQFVVGVADLDRGGEPAAIEERGRRVAQQDALRRDRGQPLARAPVLVAESAGTPVLLAEVASAFVLVAEGIEAGEEGIDPGGGGRRPGLEGCSGTGDDGGPREQITKGGPGRVRAGGQQEAA